MKASRFHVYMRAVDPAFLEEAQRPIPDRMNRLKKQLLPKAICLVIILAGLFIWKPWLDMQDSVTPEQMAEAGYVFVKPDIARNVYYSFADTPDGTAQAAQMECTVSTSAYAFRALRTDTPMELFAHPEAVASFAWTDGAVAFEYGSADYHDNWLNWYNSAEGMQYSLYAPVDKMDIMQIAVELLQKQGIPLVDTAEGAVSVVFDVFDVSDLTVRQTKFILNFYQYVFRAAATDLTDGTYPDISGEKEFSNSAEVLIGANAAQLSYDEDGEGKLLWADPAAGCVYSLYMPDDASAEALVQMAESLVG